MRNRWWGLLTGATIGVLAAGGQWAWVLSRDRPRQGLPMLGAVTDFSLVNEQGQTVTRRSLANQTWIVDFIFTECGGQCPMITHRMAQLQRMLPKNGNVQLLSISVDPAHDTPVVLAAYGRRYGADFKRWHFLTGKPSVIYALTRDGFKLSVEAQNSDTQEPILHSSRFVLVDSAGKIRGYYDGMEDRSMRRLQRDVGMLGGWGWYPYLPALNALLNALSAILLVWGYACIRARKITAHRGCMLSAFSFSTLFLISYLTYHAKFGAIPFTGQGWIRGVYFSILISHTVLAVIIVPLVLRTLYLALRQRFVEHQAWARWTLPIWLYVSVTGVVIYEMLY